MCLNFLCDLTSWLKKKDDMIIAYKVVEYDEQTKRFMPCHINNHASNLKSGKWLKASHKRLGKRNTISTNKWNQKYQVGFHCLLTLDDAINYADEFYFRTKKIIKVYVKGINATGMQKGCKTIVTKQMFIIPQEVKNSNGKRCRGLKI